MQIMNEVRVDGGALLSSQIQPMQDRIRFAMLQPANRPQAIAFAQHPDGIQHHAALRAKRLEKGALVGIECMLASDTAIAPFGLAIRPDVTSSNLVTVWTCRLIAPLILKFHCASLSALFGCVHVTLFRLSGTLFGFSGLAGQHQIFCNSIKRLREFLDPTLKGVCGPVKGLGTNDAART